MLWVSDDVLSSVWNAWSTPKLAQVKLPTPRSTRNNVERNHHDGVPVILAGSATSQGLCPCPG